MNQKLFGSPAQVFKPKGLDQALTNVDIGRDANTHILRQQTWTFGAAPAVTLHLAHNGIQINGNQTDINNFFFKHILLQSKSGKSVEQKADLRRDHRGGPKQLNRKVTEARIAGKAWTTALATPTDDFLNQFQDANFVNTLPPATQASWNTHLAALQAAVAVAGLNEAGKSKAVKQIIGRNVQQPAKKMMLDILRDYGSPESRAGMSWADKYGAIMAEANTVIVIGDNPMGDWNAGVNGTVPISRALVAERMAVALQAGVPAGAAFPVTINVVVNFGQNCVLSTSKPPIDPVHPAAPRPLTRTIQSTMSIRAKAYSTQLFDVYHYNP